MLRAAAAAVRRRVLLVMRVRSLADSGQGASSARKRRALDVTADTQAAAQKKNRPSAWLCKQRNALRLRRIVGHRTRLGATRGMHGLCRRKESKDEGHIEKEQRSASEATGRCKPRKRAFTVQYSRSTVLLLSTSTFMASSRPRSSVTACSSCAMLPRRALTVFVRFGRFGDLATVDDGEAEEAAEAAELERFRSPAAGISSSSSSLSSVSVSSPTSECC